MISNVRSTATNVPETAMMDAIPMNYYVVNLIVGTFVVSANLLMLAVIVLRREIRSQKEYVVLGANMLLDAVCGASFCLPAIGRLSGNGGKLANISSL